MAIGVNQYEVQKSPFDIGGSLAQGIAMRLAQAQAKEQEAKNPFVAAIQQELLNKNRLENKWYEPNIQSEIGYRNAGAQNLGSETDLKKQALKYPGLGKGGIEGQLAMLQFQADHPELAERINKAMQASQAKGDQSQQSQQPGQLASNIQSTMPNQQQMFSPLQILNRDINADITGKEALATFRANGMGRGGVDAQRLNMMSQQIKAENPTATPEQITDIRNAYLEGRDTDSQGNPVPPISGVMDSLLTQNYKRNTDVGQRSQERYANTLETAIKNANDNEKSAEKYSGLLGKTEGSAESAESLLGGKSSEDFKKFNNFVTVDVPTIAGEYMRELGVNASDEQKRMYKEVVNPVNWYRSPQVAMSQWSYFKKLAKDVGVTISKSSFQQHKDLASAAGYGAKNPQSSYVTPESSTAADAGIVKWGRDANGKPMRLS